MTSFEELLKRVRAGDDTASAEMFQLYQSDVKRVLRASMRVDRLRRAADPSDLYQIVMVTFFVRAALGQYSLSDPKQLKALLIKIAQNKLADLARSPALKLILEPLDDDQTKAPELADPGRGPASQALSRDLVQQIRARMTEDERQVNDLRCQGLSWDEVGAALGESADAVRMRLDRALKRIKIEMNLGNVLDE